jgi:hypothetical protein
MVRFARVTIGLALLMTTSVVSTAADLSVTPIYKTRSSIEQAAHSRGIYLGPVVSAATGKSQDPAPPSAADRTWVSELTPSIPADIQPRSNVLVYGADGH